MKQTDKTYRAYPYYDPSLAREADGLEWKCRNRRTELFAKTTGLRAVKFDNGPRGDELDLIRRHIYVDHVSAWLTKSGALFILNEPYDYSEADMAMLNQAGYEVRVVPKNLAPYGGRFDPAIGSQPRTTSMLITKRKNAGELESIFQNLLEESLIAPDWNT